MRYIKSYKLFEHKDINMRVVLTGGPGTGKSSVCDKLIKMGYKVVEEPARVLISDFLKNAPENLPWNNRDLFQKLVQEMGVNNYLNNDNCFFDRSLVDEMGYRMYYGMEIPQDLLNQCKNEYRYDIVFTFPPWKEIFKNDEVRKETFEQCLSIDRNLLDAYKKVGYNPIEVPKTNLEDRLQFILDKLK